PRTSSISCSTTAVKSPRELANVTFRPMQPEPVNDEQGRPEKVNDNSGVLSPRALPAADFTEIFAPPLIGLEEPAGVFASATTSSALVAWVPRAVRYVE